MSLPDTVFIFVLALIIFGPKKLPEIGRQIGKLVGEFRRASNEFKYQIEEELRQVDLAEKTTPLPTIAAPAPEPAAELAENIPVGQHPNIENLNPSELSSPDPHPFAFDNSEAKPEITEPAAPPVIAPAEGSLARTTVPFAADPAAPEPDVSLPKAPTSVNHTPSPAEAEITHG